MSDRFEEAYRLWLDCVNHPVDAERLALAVDPMVRVHRYTAGTEEVELIEGYIAVLVWLAFTPEGTQFLIGPLTVTDDVARVRYWLNEQGFVNGGSWRIRLADDGRIADLWHRPDPLPPTSLIMR